MGGLKKRRVVVTGIGVVAPNGFSITKFWSSLLKGESAVNVIQAFDLRELQEVNLAAEVLSFNPADFIPRNLVRKLDRFAQFGVAASRIALDDAGLDLASNDNKQIGVSIGSGLGGILFHEEQIERLINGDPDKVSAASVPRISPNSVSSYVAIVFGLRGTNLAISTACSSGANAIGVARDLIRYGKLEIVIAGGVEAPISKTTFSAYAALRVLAKRTQNPQKACRPFDKTRDGFVLGEGGGIVILESLEHATQRGEKIYAEVAGFSSSCGAYHMVTPDPSGADAASAMIAALEDAELSSSSIGYINAHGTGTIANDLAETKAVKMVFGSYAKRIPISSTKAVTGHLIGAAGAVECIVSILALRHQIIPPTANYEHIDAECDLDYVPSARSAKLHAAMSNSFGFGSNNAVLVLTQVN